MTQDAEVIDNDETVIEADVRPLPEPDEREVKRLPEPAAADVREATQQDIDGDRLPPAVPSTAVALELPPTGHELLSLASQIERKIERAKKSNEPGMGEWGAVTLALKNAASALRSAIGHTL